jgi:uncharacterized membrane protein YedE/YeeE
MKIDWLSFTPMSALAGGALIGLAAALFVLLLGRVAGISGITGGLFKPRQGDVVWRLAFVVGLVASPWAYRLITELPVADIQASWPAVLLAGLLVGLGTRYGAGCTSGHGVCGLARLSPRSLVALIAFMLAGFVTVALIRHLIT